MYYFSVFFRGFRGHYSFHVSRPTHRCVKRTLRQALILQGALRPPLSVRHTHPCIYYFSVFFRGFRGYYSFHVSPPHPQVRKTHPTCHPACIIFPCSSVGSVAIILFTFHVPIHRCVKRTLRVTPHVLFFRVLPWIPWPLFFSRFTPHPQVRKTHPTCHPALIIFPCSSVGSVALLFFSRFTPHPQVRKTHPASYLPADNTPTQTGCNTGTRQQQQQQH